MEITDSTDHSCELPIVEEDNKETISSIRELSSGKEFYLEEARTKHRSQQIKNQKISKRGRNEANKEVNKIVPIKAGIKRLRRQRRKVAKSSNSMEIKVDLIMPSIEIPTEEGQQEALKPNRGNKSWCLCAARTKLLQSCV